MAVAAEALRLADGRSVVVREATAADLAGIVDFFERLSARSRYQRFFSPQPRLRRTFIERVVAPGPDRLTVLAQPTEFRATTRHVVAVGGWIWVPGDDRCDISMAVADAWQNVALGTSVMLVLLGTALARGHTRFVADVLESNVRMLGVLGSLGARLRTRHEGGVARIEFELAPGAACVGAAVASLAAEAAGAGDDRAAGNAPSAARANGGAAMDAA